MRRLGQLQVEPLAEEQEAVEKAARQLDVVVDDEQPVAIAGAAPLKQPIEVLELSPPARGGAAKLDLVSACEQLGARPAAQATPLGALHREDQHAPAGRLAARGAAEAHAPAARELGRVDEPVADAAQARVEPSHGPARAR